MANKYKDLVKDTVIFAVGNIGSKLILFFLVPLYTASMTKEQYGTSDLIFTIAQLVLPFVSVVIYDALIRFGLSKDQKSEDVLLAAYIVLVTGTVVTFVITPLFGVYKLISNWKWQLSIYIVLSAFNASNMNYLKVKGKNVCYAVIGLTHTALMAVLNIILLAVYHLGIDGYLTANIVSMGVSVLLSIIVAGIPTDLRRAKFRKDLLINMTKFSAPLILNNISWWVVHSSDKVMVEMMLDAAALGLYTVSAKIPALINVLINIFSQAWGISSVREFENSNDSKFYSSVLEAFSFICFGASIVLIAIIKPFMRLYVSASFFDSWRYVPILLASAAFASIAYYYGSLYSALKKSGRNMATTLLAAVVNIFVNYVGIKLVGIYGAAIGTLVAYIVMAFARMIDVGRFINIRINKGRFGLICFLLLVQATLVTLDVYGYLASGVVVIIYFLLQYQMIISISRRILGRIRK